MVGKNIKKYMISAMTVLHMAFFCFASYAQPEGGCIDGAHEYVSHVLVPATEEEPGRVENVCIRCGDVSIESLPATGHVFGPWETSEGQSDGLEWRTCVRCGRREERILPKSPADAEEPPADAETEWRGNDMDYILTATTGGVWGYAAVVLWWNSLVLIWYKKQVERRKKERTHDVE